MSSSSTERISSSDVVPRPESKDDYVARLSLDAVEALATAAAMRWQHRETRRWSIDIPVHEDPSSLEAAEVLTEVLALHRDSSKGTRPGPPSDSPLSSSHSFDESESSRGKYRCGRCGQMKVNHLCPLAEVPLQRSVLVQTVPCLDIPESAKSQQLHLPLTTSSRTPPIFSHNIFTEGNDRTISVRRRKRNLVELDHTSAECYQI